MWGTGWDNIHVFLGNLPLPLLSLLASEQHLCLPQEQYYFDESAFLEEEDEEPDDDDDDTYSTRAVPTRKRKKPPKLPKPVKVKVVCQFVVGVTTPYLSD